MPVAVITGGSRGLGAALSRRLAADDWSLVVDARHTAELQAAIASWPARAPVRAVVGDVTEAAHRRELIATARALGGIDALVHNASALGASPLPALADYPLDVFEAVYRTNVLAPLALTQLALADLRAGGVVVSVTSDAAREPYPGWGAYGSSKAALEQLTAVLAAERPDLHVYSVDPGDMNTHMHAEAFPGEDISDRPPPDVSVPGIRRLLTGELPSGRYLARDLAAEQAA